MVTLPQLPLANHAQQAPYGSQRRPDQKIMPPIYPTPPNLVYSDPVLSTGNCFRSRSKRGKDRRLRWRGTDPLSGDVLSKGSPAGTRTGACWTSTLRGTQVTHGMPQMVFPGAEASQAEGMKSRRTGGLRIALLLLPRRASATARLPQPLNGQTQRMRAWRGEDVLYKKLRACGATKRPTPILRGIDNVPIFGGE